MGNRKRKAELREEILSELPWVICKMERRRLSIEKLCMTFAKRLAYKLSEAELDEWVLEVRAQVYAERVELTNRFEAEPTASETVTNEHPPCAICGGKNEKGDICETCAENYFMLPQN